LGGNYLTDLLKPERAPRPNNELSLRFSDPQQPLGQQWNLNDDEFGPASVALLVTESNQCRW